MEAIGGSDEECYAVIHRVSRLQQFGGVTLFFSSIPNRLRSLRLEDDLEISGKIFDSSDDSFSESNFSLSVMVRIIHGCRVRRC